MYKFRSNLQTNKFINRAVQLNHFKKPVRLMKHSKKGEENIIIIIVLKFVSADSRG